MRTRLRADCRGVPWSTCSDRRLSGATSTRSTRSGGPNSLVSCPNSSTLPSHLDGSGDLAQRHRLFDAVSRAIVVADRPRLLIIDDLQWCDAETIELIGFVVRSARTAPVLIVGTVRSEEIPEHHPLGGSSTPWATTGSDHRATRPARRSHHCEARRSDTRFRHD